MPEMRRNLLLLATTILWAGSAVRGVEPNAITATVTFQDGSMDMLWTDSPGPLSQNQQTLRPKYAAGITLRWPWDLKGPDDNTMTSFWSWTKEPNAVSVSTKQRMLQDVLPPNFLARLDRRQRLTSDGFKQDPNYYSVIFFAVSPEDAREMARAYLRFAQEEVNGEVKDRTDTIQRINERSAFREKRIPELEELVKTSRASLAELQKLVPYRTNEEASTAIGELDRMLNAARVDIAGIQAKIEAIQSYPADKRTEPVRAKLEVMFVEEAIALQAAEARKREATELRGQAAKFLDLNKTIADALPDIKLLTQEQRNVDQALGELNARLAQLKQREPRVLDNKVFIYPVMD